MKNKNKKRNLIDAKLRRTSRPDCLKLSTAAARHGGNGRASSCKGSGDSSTSTSSVASSPDPQMNAAGRPPPDHDVHKMLQRAATNLGSAGLTADKPAELSAELFAASGAAVPPVNSAAAAASGPSFALNLAHDALMKLKAAAMGKFGSAAGGIGGAVSEEDTRKLLQANYPELAQVLVAMSTAQLVAGGMPPPTESGLPELDVSVPENDGDPSLCHGGGGKSKSGCGDRTPLMEAAAGGHKEIVALLVDKGADVYATDSVHNGALHFAAAHGKLEVAEYLVTRAPDAVHMRNDSGRTPLMEAAAVGHVELASLLLAAGAHVQGLVTPDEEVKETPLTLAAYNNMMDMVRLLLSHQPAPVHRLEELQTALMEACSEGLEDIAELLIDAGAPVNLLDDTYEVPLVVAASNGHEHLVSLLLERGADMEAANDEGYSALMEACREGHVAVVETLLDAGAEVNAVTEESGETALTIAAFQGHIDIVRRLLRKGADAELGHRTALMEAAGEDHNQIVSYMLHHLHLRPDQINAHTGAAGGGDTAFSLAAENGAIKCMRLLFDFNADIEHRDDAGRSPLMKAARNGKYEACKFLLERGAQVNATTPQNDATAVSLAASYGHLDVVKLLVEHGADLSRCYKDNSTIVIEIAKGGHAAVMEYLLDMQNKMKARPKASGGAARKKARSLSSSAADDKFSADAFSGGAARVQQQQQNQTDQGLLMLPPPAFKWPMTKTNDTAVPTDDVSQPAAAAVSAAAAVARDATNSGAAAAALLNAQPHPDTPVVVHGFRMTFGQAMLCAALPADKLEEFFRPWQDATDAEKDLIGDKGITRPACSVQARVAQEIIDRQFGAKQLFAGAAKQPTVVTPAGKKAPCASRSVGKKTVGSSGSALRGRHSMVNVARRSKELRALVRAMRNGQQQPGDKTAVAGALSLSGTAPRCEQDTDADAEDEMEEEEDKQRRPNANADHAGQPAQRPAPTRPRRPRPRSRTSRLATGAPSSGGGGLSASSSDLDDEHGNEGAGGDAADDLMLLAGSELAHPRHEQGATDDLYDVTSEDDAGVDYDTTMSLAGVAVPPLSNVVPSTQERQTRIAAELAEAKIAPLPEYDSDDLKGTEHGLPSFFSRPDAIDIVNALIKMAQHKLSDTVLSGREPGAPLVASVRSRIAAGVRRESLGAQPAAGDAAALAANAAGGGATVEAVADVLYEEAVNGLRHLREQYKDVNGYYGEPQHMMAVLCTEASCELHAQINRERREHERFMIRMHEKQAGALPAVANAENLCQQHHNGAANSNGMPVDERGKCNVSTQVGGTPNDTAAGEEAAAAAQPNSGLDINAKTDSNHDTALTIAAAGGHQELVNVLVHRGAALELKDKRGFTALILAATAGHQRVVEALVTAGAHLETESDRTKDTALSLACSSGRKDVVEFLLKRGANKEHRNVSDYTPLSLAASSGFVDICKLLLNFGAEINSRTGSKLGISPLMLASMNGHTSVVRLLLERGADINAQIETNRNTALTLACFQGRTDVVKVLIQYGANIEHRAKTGLTPLMEAASGGYVDVGRALVEAGADVNAPATAQTRDTALTIAADKGHAPFAELLLDFGAQVNVRNKKGQTPVALAAANGHHELVRTLISHSATASGGNKPTIDVDLADNRRITPLVAAFREGHVQSVRYLVPVPDPVKCHVNCQMSCKVVKVV